MSTQVSTIYSHSRPPNATQEWNINVNCVFWFQYSILFKQEHGESHFQLVNPIFLRIFLQIVPSAVMKCTCFTLRLCLCSAHDDAIWTAAWGRSEADASETIVTGSLDDMVKVWKWQVTSFSDTLLLVLLTSVFLTTPLCVLLLCLRPAGRTTS